LARTKGKMRGCEGKWRRTKGWIKDCEGKLREAINWMKACEGKFIGSIYSIPDAISLMSA